MAYDIIGDIHGQAYKLRSLLCTLGYIEKFGTYHHSVNPDRTVIFVGDFIDRGPNQLECVNIVRRMMDAGTAQAVMGNHEFNAIAWHTEDPDETGKHLRVHSLKNEKQHAAFLTEIAGNAALHKEITDWFLTLSLWLDLPQLRVVHACWHDGYMRELQSKLTPGNKLTRELMVAASRDHLMEFRCTEGLTKGLEIDLPAGCTFEDEDGHIRSKTRICWWNADATTYRDLAVMPDSMRHRLPNIVVDRMSHTPYDNIKPLFFGHYWKTGEQQLLSPMIACVDYSAAKDGPLVAYRWDGESVLDSDNFVQHDSENEYQQIKQNHYTKN